MADENEVLVASEAEAFHLRRRDDGLLVTARQKLGRRDRKILDALNGDGALRRLVMDDVEAKVGRVPTEGYAVAVLQFIIDHWEEIYAIIQTIMALFNPPVPTP